MDATVSSPVSIALVNDYDIVVMDLAHISASTKIGS
jgi:hypothetical protein